MTTASADLVERVAEAIWLSGGPAYPWGVVAKDGHPVGDDYRRDAQAAISVVLGDSA